MQSRRGAGFKEPPLSDFAFQEVGRPSVGSLGLSTCLHGVVVAALALISFGPPREAPKPRIVKIDPTTIKIGDRIYFVARLTPQPRPPATIVRRRDLAPKQFAVKRTPPRPEALQAPVPAPPAPAPAPADTPAPRTFVPPEVKPNLISDATLIQPLSPPDLIPQVVPLPSFRVWTAPALPPKIPKPFVAPGRKIPTESEPPPVISPDLNLVHADPLPTEMKAKLTLPATLPPIMEPKPVTVTPPEAMGRAKAGDPVSIISLSDHPVPPTDKIVVPAGNLIGKTGEESGTGLGASRGGNPAGAAGGTSDADASKTNASGSSANSAVSGASSASATAVGASASALGRNPGPRVITRPPNGTFDAVVVQSSPDQFSEAKDLLTGRPIYTVYISVGTSKDWALYFCVPGEKGLTSSDTRVVQLGAATPVQAPYPTRIVRPDVTVASYVKYILVHGFVNSTGRFEKLRVVRPITPETDQAIVASLAEWQFRAATRDGVKVAVEFLLSIPLSGL